MADPISPVDPPGTVRVEAARESPSFNSPHPFANQGLDSNPGTPDVPSPQATTAEDSTRPSRQPYDLGHIGNYVIETELGRGGMGVVYRARQVGLNRTVALKMILNADHVSPETRGRFLREAQALAQLKHDHIVQIYEVGEHDGKPYFSLEYVEGGSLDRLLRASPLSATQAASLLKVLAHAMHVAHQAGIIHRDLKPANILLATCGSAEGAKPQALVPKITDFGLARRGDESGQTHSGAVIGTPSYMAPEQAAGQVHDLDARADVYALGAILYECLTGRPPFRAATVLDTLKQVMDQEPVPPRQLQPGVPVDLETICLKCLQKDRDKRYASSEELAADLGRFRRGEPVQARPVGRVEKAWRWCRRNPVVAALMAAVVAALCGGTAVSLIFLFQARRDFEKAEEARKNESFQKEAAIKAGEEARKAQHLAEQERDHKRAEAYRNLIGRAHASWQMNQPEEAKRLLASTEPALRGWEFHYLNRLFHYQGHFTFPAHSVPVAGVAISPNGRYLVSGTRSLVRLWNAAERTIIRTVEGSGRVYFSPGGGYFACAGGEDGTLFGEGDGVVRVWRVGNGESVLTFPHPIKQARACLAFSPNGRHLVIGIKPIPPELGEIRVVELATGKTVFAREKSPSPHDIAYSSDGLRLALAMDSGRVWTLDANTGRLLADDKVHTFHVTALCYSPDGKRLATAARDNRVKVREVETGRELMSVEAHRATVGPICLAFSPDGHLLASGGEDRLVRVWDAATGQVRHTFRGHHGHVTAVAFSADGRRVISSGEDGAVKIWDAELGQDVFELCDPEGDTRRGSLTWQIAFDPDEQRMLTVENRRVSFWNSASGARTHTIPFSVTASFRIPTVSPDLRLLALEDDPKEQSVSASLWDLSTGERKSRFVTGVANRIPGDNRIRAMSFHPDGRRLALCNAVDVKLWDALEGRELCAFHGPDGKPVTFIRYLAFSGDGRLLAGGGMKTVIHLWESETGRLSSTISFTAPAAFSGLHAIALTPDGRRLVGARDDGIVMVWNVSDGRLLTELTGHAGGIRGLAITPDGSRILTGGTEDGNLRVWDAERGDLLLTLAAQGGSLSHFQLSPDGRRLATVHRGKKSGRSVAVWDATPCMAPTILRAASPDMTGLRIGPDGHVATASTVGIQLFSPGGGMTRLFGKQASSVKDVTPLAFRADGKRLASVGFDRKVHVWDIMEGKEVVSFAGPDRQVLSLCYSADGGRLALGTRPRGESNRDGPGEARVWDAESGQELFVLEGHSGPVNCVAFRPDGTMLAAGVGLPKSKIPKREVKLWDLVERREVRTLAAHEASVLHICFSPDAKRLASAGGDRKLKLWDVESGRELWAITINFGEGYLSDVRFSADGKCVICRDDLGSETARDADTGKRRPEAEGGLLRDIRSLSAMGWVSVRGDRKEGDLHLNPRPPSASAVRLRHLTEPDLERHRVMVGESLRLGSPEDAAYHAGLLLKREPWDAETHAYRAYALHRLGQPRDAVKHYLHALFLNPRVNGWPEDAEARTRAGMHAESGRWTEAAEEYWLAAHQPGAKPNVWFETLLARRAAGQDTAFARGLQEMLSRFGDSKELAEVGWLLAAARLGPCDASVAIPLVEIARKVHARDPDGTSKADLGIALYRAGRTVEALPFLRGKVLHGQPFAVMAEFRLGQRNQARDRYVALKEELTKKEREGNAPTRKYWELMRKETELLLASMLPADP